MQVEEYLNWKRKMQKEHEEELGRAFTLVIKTISEEIDALKELIEDLKISKNRINEEDKEIIDNLIRKYQEEEDLLKIWLENNVNES